MKRFLIQIAVFFALLITIDRAAGFCFGYMSKHSKGGYVAHHNYITDGVNEDILIFGSSRANHHYNPQLFKDSLNLSCYNCGQEGNGIILYYGWWQIITERYHPKYLVYDIEPKFDLLRADDNHQFLGWLKESYDRANIRSIFYDVDKTECYKMNSMLYRYNSKFHQIIADYIHPIYVVKKNGFIPLVGELDTMKIKRSIAKEAEVIPQFDPLKINYLSKLVDNANGVKIIFTVSPIWYGLPTEYLEPIKTLCNQKGITLIDYSNNPKYLHNDYYFKDGRHLNSIGADEYTKDIISELKKREMIFVVK